MIVNGTTPKQILKRMAADSGVPLKDLLVLSATNDPFNCGGPSQVEQAQWFKSVWDAHMGFERGHLRKFHYKLISQAQKVLKPDGTPYSNTASDWEHVQLWSKFARYLGYVDPQRIIDNRNPEPHLFTPDPVDAAIPSWNIEQWYGFNLPRIDSPTWADFSFPEIVVEGWWWDHESLSRRLDSSYSREIHDQSRHVLYFSPSSSTAAFTSPYRFSP